MKWAVEIQRTSLGERNLSDLLHGLGFSLVGGMQPPAMSSPEIEGCMTAKDVFEIAKSVRAAFRKSSAIDSEFTLGSVLDFSTDPPVRHVFLEVDSCVHNHNVFFPPTLTISPPNDLPAAELERWNLEQEELQYQAKLERQRSRLEPAYFSQDAAKVMELLSVKNPSAEALYKVYELVEGRVGSKAALHQQFGISQYEFDRFRDAIHKFEVTGDWARHARSDRDSPRTSNPMDKGEAEAFVRDIADKWLRSLRRR